MGSEMCIRDSNHGSDYTPYEGLEIIGWPVQTWLRGNKIFDNGEFTTVNNLGKYMSRDFSSF